MASTADVYLPDLGKCLDGETLLLSWEDVLESLLSHRSERADPLTSFFQDNHVRNLFSPYVPSFSRPSATTKSQFETRTAAVNITPSAHQLYDIEELKTDALWLSSEIQLDELESIRLAVLEWQQRPKLRLEAGLSDAELASLKDAVGSELTPFTRGADPQILLRHDSTLDTQDARRCRLVQLYADENAAMYSVSEEIQQACLLENLLPDSDLTALQRAVAALFHETMSPQLRHITQLLEALQRRFSSLDSTNNAFSNEGSSAVQHHLVMLEASLGEILVLLERLLLEVRSSDIAMTSAQVISWHEFMVDLRKVEEVAMQSPKLIALAQKILNAAMVVWVSVLNPSLSIAHLAQAANPDVSQRPSVHSEDSEDYFLDADWIADIHTTLYHAAQTGSVWAAPAVLAWALIVGSLRQAASIIKESQESQHVQRVIDTSPAQNGGVRRSSGGLTDSLQQSIYETIFDKISSVSSAEDPVAYMLASAVDGNNTFEVICQVLSMETDHTSLVAALRLQTLQDLVSASIEAIGYSSEVISAQLAILGCTGSSAFDPRSAFVENEFLMRTVFETAIARFPYESLPFLQLCRALAKAEIFDEHGMQYITFRLRNLSSFTQSATSGVSSYRTIREDENANLVQLERPLNMLGSSHGKLVGGESGHRSSEIVDHTISEETIGEVISESVPAIIRWRHQYSGLALFGSWLELYYSDRLHGALSPFEDVYDVVTEIVCLFATLVKATSRTTSDKEDKLVGSQQVEVLIEQSSLRLSYFEDIVSLITEILEQQLQLFRRRNAITFPLSLINACLDFVNSVATYRVKQVWGTISKTSLLGSSSGGGLLLPIIESAEVPIQEFSFLAKCSETYNVLIDIGFQGPEVTRYNGSSRSSSGGSKGTPAIKAQVVAFKAYTQAMLVCFDAMSLWSFRSEIQRSQVAKSLAAGFDKVLQYAYSIEVEEGVSPGSTAVFKHSASLVAASLTAVALPGIGSNALLSAVASTNQQMSAHNDVVVPPEHSAVAGLMRLCDTLLKCDTTKVKAFAAQLVYELPLLTRFVVREGTSRIALHTFGRLLQPQAQTHTTSLLGNLGSVSAISFLNCLEQIFVDPLLHDRRVLAWNLLTALISSSQQWFAVVILTGLVPAISARQANEQNKVQALRHKSFLTLAIDKILHVKELPEKESISIMEFLVEAAANWSWASDSISSNPELFPVLFSYMAKLEDTKAENALSHGYKLVSLITDLASVNMHRLKARRDRANLKTYFPLITWLSGNALECSSYNASLHSNLRKNFALKYPSLQIKAFQRSADFQAAYGDEYFYDINIADKVLAHDPHWIDGKNDNGQSFRAELRRANLNLSLVDAELKLLRSFKALCIDHCVFFSQDREVQKVMARVVENCLRANTMSYPAEAIFDDLFQTRADLAAALLRQLVDINARGSDFLSLLNPAWDCARFRNGTWDLALTNNDLIHWRSMLSILVLSLQFHIKKKSKPTPTTSHAVMLLDPANSVAVELTSSVICDGLKSIMNALHDQHRKDESQREASTAPDIGRADVALLLSLFQAILRLPSLPQFADQLSAILTSTGIGQVSLTLYSWSHILVTPADEEPIYADMCLQLLVSVSSLPRVAEDLAVEGVLSRILTARVTQTIQGIPNGASALDRRPHARSFYLLWSLGLLPLCLNLLHNVGVGVAAEVSAFLNQFPNQLSKANMAFVPIPARATNESDQITLATASECSTLALISFILSSYRTAGASAGVDPTSIASLEGYDEDKKILAEDVQDLLKGGEAGLMGRVVPTDGNELALQKAKDGDMLTKKVFSQLEQALVCLRGSYEDEE